MSHISLASALVWRNTRTGVHPLFATRKGAEPSGRALARARAAVEQFGLEPTKYSMSFNEMGVLYQLVERRKPGIVVEFGSGVSTQLLLAMHRERGYPQRIISFDQASEYIEQLREALAAQGLAPDGVLEAVHAPLVATTLQNQPLRFYDPAIVARTLAEVRRRIDLFVVDGPSGGGWNRFLAGVIGAAFGGDGATLVLHDALRDWELACAVAWESLGLTRGSRFYPVERGLMAAPVIAAADDLLDGIGRATPAAYLGISQKGDRIELREAMRAATDLVVTESGSRVPVTVKSLKDLHSEMCAAEPEAPFAVTPPANLADLGGAQRNRLLLRDTVSTLPGGSVHRLGTAILTKKAQILVGGAVVAENMEGEYAWQGLSKDRDGWGIDLDRPLDVEARPALLLEKHGVKNYSLWWMEILTRAYFAYHRAQGVPRRVVLCESASLDEEALRFREETLRVVAGSDLEIAYCRHDTLVLDAWLASVSHYARTKTRWNQYTRALREHVLASCARAIARSPYTRARHRRIFVARQDSHVRVVSNMKALERELEKRRFFVVNPGQLSWIDQIALFAQASVVVGVHGAGMLNILWSGPDTQVVEIYTRATLNRNTFRHIAAQMGMPYRVYLEDDARVVDAPNTSDSLSIDVDIERLMGQLAGIGILPRTLRFAPARSS